MKERVVNVYDPPSAAVPDSAKYLARRGALAQTGLLIAAIAAVDIAAALTLAAAARSPGVTRL